MGYACGYGLQGGYADTCMSQPPPGPDPPGGGSGNSGASYTSPTTSAEGTLGCSQHVAYVQGKCNGARLCELLDAVEIKYDRRLDDASEASVTIAISGDVDNPCCACLADVEPWCHVLTIVREGDGVVWTGPIQKVTYGYDQVVIEAKDKLAWLQVRINECAVVYGEPEPGPPNTTVMLTQIAADIAMIAMSEDDSSCFGDTEDGIIVMDDGLPVGENRTRALPPFAGPTAFDDLQLMAESGVDYTVINGVLILTGEDLPNGSIGVLTDEMILGDIEVIKDGTQLGNRWYIRYDGDDDPDECQDNYIPADSPQCEVCGDLDCFVAPCPAVRTAEDTECYGIVERLLDPGVLTRVDDAEVLAQTYVDRFRLVPWLLEFPPGTKISPDVPWPLSRMIPGQRMDVSLSKLCLPVFRRFKLQQVTVLDKPEGEEISIDLKTLEGE